MIGIGVARKPANKIGPVTTAVHWCLTKLFGKPEVFWVDPQTIHYARWCLKRSRTGECTYLHHFLNGDGRPHPHNHPKKFVSIGLWGSYVEEVFDRNLVSDVNRRRVLHRAPWKRTFFPNHTHRICRVDRSCWTLVRTSSYVTNWGFFVKDVDGIYRWVPHEDYDQRYGTCRGFQDDLIWG